MFANVERERDWCRHIKVNIPSADRQGERERCVCVFFLNFVSFVVVFLLWELVYVFQSLCRSLQKNLIIKMSSGFTKAFWFSEGRTK